MYTYRLKRSTRKDKKWMVVSETGKTTHFGAKGYQDYTQHKDIERQRNYVSRHRKSENWGITGRDTAGFWARWLLWNKPSLTSSIREIQRRFKVRVRR